MSESTALQRYKDTRSHCARPVFCKAACAVANFWHKSNRHVITFVYQGWLTLLKQRCDLGRHLVYSLVLDTIVFKKTLAQRTKRCNSVVCEQQEGSHTTLM